MAGYQDALEAQKLYLLAVREQALAGDPAAVRDLLQRDLVFWRQALASSDLLISKMIATAAVRRHFALGNLALRALPADLTAGAVPPSWQRPLALDERSLVRSLGGEWRYVGAALRTAMAPEARAADPERGMSDLLLRPLYQPQATVNLYAARMVRMGELSELPYPEIDPALESLLRSGQDAGWRLSLYNPVGVIIDSVGPESAYAKYIARSGDLEGIRRAALLVATLRAE